MFYRPVLVTVDGTPPPAISHRSSIKARHNIDTGQVVYSRAGPGMSCLVHLSVHASPSPILLPSAISVGVLPPHPMMDRRTEIEVLHMSPYKPRMKGEWSSIKSSQVEEKKIRGKINKTKEKEKGA